MANRLSYPDDKKTLEALGNNHYLEIDIDQPPPYEVASSSRTQSSSELRIPQDEIKTQKNDCAASFWSSLTNPYGWICVIYFLFVSFPIGVAAICWILPTFAVAIVSMLFPPVGYFFCIGVAWSWRALARIEIFFVQLCVREKIPKHVIPPVTKLLRDPHELPTATQPRKLSWIKYFTGICFDRFTWIAFVYFVFVKSLICVITFALTVALVCMAGLLMLFCMPILLIACRKMGEWEFKLMRAIFFPQLKGMS
ncbi:4960_t:CDS:2 [Ambispora gerdemannii]|uniref:4960_t:CDS:1 n=1 Tax=Ambispora gerdemannii TaxID=144530 RepID=A0A9N9D637_9GLOM|nr:4960_t:CDS:2 [Ambispora gerdemannii]